MTTTAEPTTQLLGRYTVAGTQRELHAVRVPDEQTPVAETVRIIDVLAHPLAEDSDIDAREVEESVPDLSEAEAIAADYIALAQHRGWVPMDGLWW
jgi:hypothetical protein